MATTRDLPIDTTTVAGRADVSVHELAQEGARLRTNLQYKIRQLARTLNDEADRLHSNPDHIPLSHGIVQSEGPEIDRLCALLGAKKEELKRAIWVVKNEAK